MRRQHVQSPDWVGVGGGLGRRNRQWEHRSIAGLAVRHCGHPTALRPYYVVDLLDELGAFSLLAQAQNAGVLARQALQADPQALVEDADCWRIRAQALGLGADFPMPK